MKALIDRLEPEYRKLADEICTSHLSYPGLQAVLKALLSERVSIRNLHIIIESVAEISAHTRRTDRIVEHVRQRLSQQICSDIAVDGTLSILRLGPKWDLAFHENVKRDTKETRLNLLWSHGFWKSLWRRQSSNYPIYARWIGFCDCNVTRGPAVCPHDP